MIKRDLWRGHVLLAIADLLIFLTIYCCMTSWLEKNIAVPIKRLEKEIQNPHKFKKAQEQANIPQSLSTERSNPNVRKTSVEKTVKNFEKKTSRESTYKSRDKRENSVDSSRGSTYSNAERAKHLK